ncbi:MAG: hypothetical protein K2P81_00900 [Bacteriovoracaceae bacterium]|nr:hypothetical protein [Bacteriovoracaceae bacterium]
MDTFTKIIELLMNLMTAKSQGISKQIVLTARKLILLILLACLSAALFCVGVSMVVIDVAQKIENPVMVGSILASVALIGLILCLNQKQWLKSSSIKEEATPRGPSPIEQALALLITDIVSERQLKRAEMGSSSLKKAQSDE